MQKDISTAHGGFVNCISSETHGQSDGFGYTSVYSSIFPPKPYLFSLTPSDCSTDEDNNINSPIAVDYMQALELASYSTQSRINMEHQELIDRHNLCLSHLREAEKEAEALRQENVNLRIANVDLNERLSLLVQASLHNRFVSPSDFTTSSLLPSALDSFRRMCIGEKATSERHAWDETSNESPTSVIENDRVERIDVNRVSLPKSISVRSKGYLKALQAGGSNGDRVRAPNRIKTVSPVDETQKVYVNGGKKEEQPVELEVFNQGMLKTELCNKWQETGACPYGDHCQFAHGIGELRPVLRHPRYKTEVCRMVLAGDRCPYGHRCHFRHTLTDEEKLMIPLRPRVVKVDQ